MYGQRVNVMNGKTLWNIIVDSRFVKEKCSKSWIITFLMFGYVAMMAGYLPIFLYVFLDMKYIIDESKFFMSFNTISFLLDWYGYLVLVLLLYGVITFLLDWAKPWIEKAAREPDPIEATLMPRKGDDAWL
jgi:hypothetical protein